MREIAYLSDHSSPLRIEYSRPVMELIRERGMDGLMALPRVGMGVGGLLLGERQGGRIRLLDSIDLPCSHSIGPSFTLTDAEKARTRELIASAGQVPVIGWYCSKTHGAATLDDADLAFYEELFPEAWHIALVIRPN